VIATVTKNLLNKLLRKSYREAYVEENVRTGVAYQIRALREKRGWSQKKLAQVLSKPQSVVSRIEDPDYGKLSIQTLLEVASALDVALLVQYVAFPEFIERMEDVSPEGLNRPSFDPTQFQVIDGDTHTVDVLRKLQLQIANPNTLTLAITANNLTAYPDDFVMSSGANLAGYLSGKATAGHGETIAKAWGVYLAQRHAPDPQAIFLTRGATPVSPKDSDKPTPDFSSAWNDALNPNQVGTALQ